MSPSPRRRPITPSRRFFFLLLVLFVSGFFAYPAIAEFLGPDRTTVQFVEVRDPDNDVWTLYLGDVDFCLIIHTCEEHPSVERQQALCGWTATRSGCDKAYKIEERTITLPEATITDDLGNCTLNAGWCITSPTLRLSANEPLDGESITVIEGTRNGEPFACPGDLCDVPLVEGGNDFAFWALSTYGDSSQMGSLSAQVDTVPPTSAFISPLEGSVVWANGVLEMLGSSSDATSGVASVELSLDGGASWSALDLGTDGIWSHSWDTATVADGIYYVLARSSDLAGHLESTAQITIHVDNRSPKIRIPDSWYIWEPLAIQFDDSGVGVKKVALTICGGDYGDRSYKWTAGNVPDDFIWDRRFGEIIAPIGEYEVSVEAWDQLGNKSSASGEILIPAPEPTTEPSPEPTDAPESTPTETALPTTTPSPGSSSKAIVWTPTVTSAAIALALEPENADAASVQSEGPSLPPAVPESEANPLLWGSAALALAGAATTYALSRRKARQAYIEEMRREAARLSSPEARERRLQSIRDRALARVKPAREAIAAAIAAGAGIVAAASQAATEQVRRWLPEDELPDASQEGASGISEATTEDLFEPIDASPHGDAGEPESPASQVLTQIPDTPIARLTGETVARPEVLAAPETPLSRLTGDTRWEPTTSVLAKPSTPSGAITSGLHLWRSRSLGFYPQ